MPTNIMELLMEVDRRTRELWVLLNEDEEHWQPIYDEVLAGPRPYGISDGAPASLILASKLHLLAQTMQGLWDEMARRHGFQVSYASAAGASIQGVDPPSATE